MSVDVAEEPMGRWESRIRALDHQPESAADPFAGLPHTAELTGDDATSDAGTPGWSRWFVDGEQFVFSSPSTVPAVWGSGDHVAWAAGESLLIVGPQGVGKTTIMQQVVLARIGLRDDALGMPVASGERRVLYIAADRPRQAQRSLARMVDADESDTLRDRLIVWRGPPPHDLAAYPGTLARMAAEADADTVVIDSIKDVAIGIAKDEVGAALNRAFQLALRDGVEVAGLHHQTKRGAGGVGRPTTLADVYGSVWITSGAGSVLLVWGEAGDLIVDVTHLKQPANDIGPLKAIHDHRTGTTLVYDRVDPRAFVEAGNGVTARQLAAAVHETDKPKPNQVEKARRELDRLVTASLAYAKHGQKGGADGGEPTRYYPTTRLDLAV